MAAFPLIRSANIQELNLLHVLFEFVHTATAMLMYRDLTSKLSSGTVSKWGDRGKRSWPELLNVPKGVFVAIAAPVLVGVLVILEILTIN